MPIRFLLNGVAHSEEHVAPSTTVLDWLRGPARLTGTKEGCAEGDCGACTIAVARPGDDGGPRYQAVNACLMLLPQLDGCAVRTVEGLADGAELHPAQSAMIDADGTQCGFCTPGFLMSMFAYAQGGDTSEENAIHEALAGNLCRCTGYRPIVESARKIAGLRTPRIEAADKAVPAPAAQYQVGVQLFLAPRSLQELADARRRHPDALLLAGGTDLGLLASKERRAFPAIVSTAHVAEMRDIATREGTLRIGAAVTYTEALPPIERHYPAFGEIIRRIGSRQIRNLGTLAGNVANASPIGDTIPCLIAIGAEVELDAAGERRRLPVEDFITGYRKTALKSGEVIVALRLPLPAKGAIFRAYKLSKRFDQDISTVVAAFSLTLKHDKVERLRAAFGGMAAKSARAVGLEAALAGKPWTAGALQDADALIARDFAPMTDQRGTAAYRLRAGANLVRRLQIETTGHEALTRVEAL